MKQAKKLSDLNKPDDLKELSAAIGELRRQVSDLTELVTTQQEVIEVYGEHIRKIRKALHSL